MDSEYLHYIYPGGYDGSSEKNDILEYDPGTRNWTQIGTMREARWVSAVSVVHYDDYTDFCQ